MTVYVQFENITDRDKDINQNNFWWAKLSDGATGWVRLSLPYVGQPGYTIHYIKPEQITKIRTVPAKRRNAV